MVDFKKLMLYFKRGVAFSVAGIAVSWIMSMLLGASTESALALISGGNWAALLGIVGVVLIGGQVINGFIMTEIVNKWVKK